MASSGPSASKTARWFGKRSSAPSSHSTAWPSTLAELSPASMTARLLELQRTRHDPVYPPDNYTAACDMMRANGGYFAPWAGPPPPPPPPIPPTVDCTFVGEMDQYPGSWQPGSRDGVASTSPEDCCKQCKKDLACFVGVFAALDGSPGLCYMKPNNATDRPREGCTSCYPKHSIDD